MNSYLVTIIVPVHNTAEYIHQCLDSILHQTYRNLEIICVDDGSTDESLSILNVYGKNESRIKVLSQPNKGVSKARNLAIGIAEGDYVMFVDSDDWIEEDTVETLLKAAVTNGTDMSFCSYVKEFPNHSVDKKIFHFEDSVFSQREINEFLLRKLIGLIDQELSHPEDFETLSPVCMKLYDLDVINKNYIRFVDIDIIWTSEDLLFNIDYLRVSKGATYINECLYHYRKNRQLSITTSFKTSFLSKRLALFKEIELRVNKSHFRELYSKALSNRISLSVIGLGLNAISGQDSIRLKISRVKDILNSEVIADSLSKFAFRFLPIYWKMFFFFAKSRNAIALTLLLAVINKIIRR